MQITKEQKDYIESIIKECSGYKGNELLLDEFCNEVIRRAYSIISDQTELNNIKVYLKRIANAAILEVIRNSVNLSLSRKDNKDQENFRIKYEFDENGDILLNYDISFDETSSKQVSLSEEQISHIKDIIKDSDEKESSFSYKVLYELRYIDGLSNREIAQKLELQENEVDKKLLFMLGKIRKESFCFSN